MSSSQGRITDSKLLQQAGLLFKPKNLLKTVAGQVPLVSAIPDLIDQIEGQETEDRIQSLEADVKALAELKRAAGATPQIPPVLRDWSDPISEFLRRTVDFAVVYDGGFHSPGQSGRTLVQPVAHACIVGPGEVIGCREAIETVLDVATHKSGRAVLLIGMAWFGFEPGKADDTSGLSLCRIGSRDEAAWQDTLKLSRKYDLPELTDEPIKTKVKFTITPWMGQEFGFIHTGEATDVLRGMGEFSKRQFDFGAISHLRRPREGAFKAFVSNVLPGRVLRVGSPAFSRDGVLLGVVSDVESYSSDAGRRVVVRSLLGHPHFMASLKKPTTK